MSSPKIVIWILWSLVAVVFVLTSGLWWLNRASEKVQVNLPTAVLVGFGAILVTLVFSLKPETVKEEFPTDFIVDPIVKVPFWCRFFPGVDHYTDPGKGGGIRSGAQVVVQLLQENPHLREAMDNPTLEHIYRDVLLSIVLDTLSFTFSKSWDATVTHFRLPTGREGRYQAASDPPRPGTRVQRKDLIDAHFSQFYALRDDDFLASFVLPPNTAISGVSDQIQTVLKFKNTFATVEIAIKPRGVKSGLGWAILNLCRLEWGESDKFRTVAFTLSLSAEFNWLRSGHPQMPDYKKWVTIAFAELRRLSSEVRWAETKEDYQLLYAHRTESHIDEMLRKAREQLESGK
jgi:hypothetical protein